MHGRRPLLILLGLQLLGWWWVHQNLPYLGVAFNWPSTGYATDRHRLIAFVDSMPVAKEQFLEFDLEQKSWRSLNRRQMIVREAPEPKAQAYWQLMSARPPNRFYGAELFDSQSLKVLKRYQLPYVDWPYSGYVPRIIGNRFATVVLHTSIETIDLNAQHPQLNRLDHNPALHHIFHQTDSGDSLVVYSAKSLDRGVTGLAELYRFNEAGELIKLAEWPVHADEYATHQWKDRVVTISPNRTQAEIRSSVTGELVSTFDVPRADGRQAYSFSSNAQSAPLLLCRFNNRLTCIRMDTGEWLPEPPGGGEPIGALPAYKLMLYQQWMGGSCVYDPSARSVVTELPTGSLSIWQKNVGRSLLRDESSTTLVDRQYGLSFYRFDHALQRVTETYRPFFRSTWILAGLVATQFVWSLAWLGWLPARLFGRRTEQGTSSSGSIRHPSMWLDTLLVIAIPLALCACRLLTCGDVSSDRPAYHLTTALCNAMLMVIAAWILLGDAGIRSKWPAGLWLLLPCAVILWLKIDEPSRTEWLMLLPWVMCLPYLQFLRMIGFRISDSRVVRTATKNVSRRVTLGDYFVLTFLIAIWVAALSLLRRPNPYQVNMQVLIGVLIGIQLLMMQLALARWKILWWPAALIASICVLALVGMAVVQMGFGLLMPSSYFSYYRLPEIGLAATTAATAFWAFAPLRARRLAN